MTNASDLMQPVQLALTIAFDVSKQILGPDHEQTKCMEAVLKVLMQCRRMTNIIRYRMIGPGSICEYECW